MTSPEERIRADIQSLGWHVVLMPETETRPSWGYTVGLFAKHRHPELSLFGLPVDDTKVILDAAARHVRTGTVYTDGHLATDLLDGCSCVFKKVQPTWYRAVMNAAVRYYGGTTFPALQGFYPDGEGNFPWDAECDPGFMSIQPTLFESEGGPDWLGELAS